MSQSVVLLASDPKTAQSLAGGLGPHFHSVVLANTRDELREKVASHRPEAVVVEVEHSRLTDVRNLHQDFPALAIVCTHRIPDEELWMAALEAGASDVCPSDDVQNVLSSVLRSVAIAKMA
jgi:DNA-binding NarL/FixJ family response regulator